MPYLQRMTRNRFIFLSDVIIVGLCYLFTIVALAVISGGFGEGTISGNKLVIVIASAVYAGFLYIFGCYHIYWIYAGTVDYFRVLMACIVASVVCDITARIYNWSDFGLTESVVCNFSSTIMLLSFRMLIRITGKICRSLNKKNGNTTKNILIVGAGRLGVALVKDVMGNQDINYHVLGFVDDSPAKRNQIIYGVKVLGTTDDLERISKTLKPDEVIIAISNASMKDKQRIISVCSDLGCKMKIVPGFADTLKNKKAFDFVREVEVEDLLEREPVKLDNSIISSDIAGRVIMVTGGGGSIGSELCRQIARFMPEKLIVVDIYENNAFDLQNELYDKFPDLNTEIVIASVRDRERMREIFGKYKPYMVFHAAAHKHVPLMEDNPSEAVKNNVFGTYNTACCANEFEVKKFVLISTDKAVNPTNVMGATKRVCEMIVQAMQTISKNTEFVAVRFGNVLNSNGSVVPRFKTQIKNGGPITVTHKEITRFFMTIPEAAQLVLQAAAYAKGGEIFVLDMGEPVKIYDLAVNLIKLSGLRPDADIKIKITGLRPGEKLYEELLMNEEGLKKTSHNKIFIGEPFFDSMDELKKKLEILKNAVEAKDNDGVKIAVASVVPTYKPADNSLPQQEGVEIENSKAVMA